MSVNQSSHSVFLWHHPADVSFVNTLANDLLERGLEVHFNKEEGTFNPVDWRLSTSDCVIFMLSQTSLAAPSLRGDIEKVLRRDHDLAIPALIDSEAGGNLPFLFTYTRPLDFYSDYEKALEDLLKEVHHKEEGKPSPLQATRNLWTRLKRRVFHHFRRYMLLPPLTFSWQITVENLIISLTVTGFITTLFQPLERTNLDSLTASSFIWGIIVLGPIVETFLLQTIPVYIGRLLGLSFFGQILISVVPFAWLHFTRSIGAGIGAGIIGGFYSAFTYVHWLSKTPWKAFWVTALSHGLYNLALFTMIIGEY